MQRRVTFHSLIRGPNMKFCDFIPTLKVQEPKCNFGNQMEIKLSDRLIADANHLEIQNKPLLKNRD